MLIHVDDLKHTQASFFFLPISTYLLHLRIQVIQMPWCRDLVILVMITDKMDCFIPCACSQSNEREYYSTCILLYLDLQCEHIIVITLIIILYVLEKDTGHYWINLQTKYRKIFKSSPHTSIRPASIVVKIGFSYRIAQGFSFLVTFSGALPPAIAFISFTTWNWKV